VAVYTSRCLVGLATFLLPAAAHAHFVLQAPAAATQQSALGDPQKAPPCGDDGSAVATGEVTAYQAGETITVTIDETIYHPGHYRIALAVNDPSELPPEPVVTPDNVSPCGSAPIDPAPVFPVLADGVFVHDSQFGKPQSIDITLPDDISCTSCTLQIIQFMSNHGLNDPGGCYYHHCATISIEGGAAETSADTGVDGSSDDDDATDASATDPDPTTDGGPSDGASADDMADDAATMTASAGETGMDTDTDATGAPEDDGDDGCGCVAGQNGSQPLPALFGVFGLAAIARRRRA
jgi:MYXO-CTERM domain-containing protein